MQPQDTYNREFERTTAALDDWLSTLSDVAFIDREKNQGYWRARMAPHHPDACPAELMISRGQSFDIEVGPESVANQRVAALSLFLPLLQAVADGRVVHRCWSALTTGCQLTREIIVHLADGSAWSMSRVVSAGNAETELSSIARDRVYLPYRRA